MKKLLTLLVATAILFASCNDGASSDGDKDNENDWAKINFTTENSNLKITKIDAEKEFVFENPNAKTGVTSIDKCIIKLSNRTFKKDKNYKLSLDLKADSESVVRIGAVIQKSGISSSDYFSVGKEYSTHTLKIGTAAIDTKEGFIELGLGSVEKLYMKNFKVEEIPDSAIVGKVWCSKDSDMGKMEYSSNSLKEAKIKFKDGVEGGTEIYFPQPAEVGKIYKCSFTIKSDVAIKSDEIGYWGQSIVQDDRPWDVGSNKFEAEANVEKKVFNCYMPIYRLENETQRCPKFWFNSKKACTLTISNIEIEEVSGGIEELKKEGLGLYFGWYVPANEGISIPANGNVRTQFLLCDKYGWDSTQNGTASIRWISDKTDKNIFELKQDPNDGANFTIKNKTNKDMTVTFHLDENYKVVLEEKK